MKASPMSLRIERERRKKAVSRLGREKQQDGQRKARETHTKRCRVFSERVGPLTLQEIILRVNIYE